MTAEQLENARKAAWRQDGNALLTADDARAWLRETGLALHQPRPKEIAAPAPSFLEAVAGTADPATTAASTEASTRLLARLLSSGDAVALSLLPNASLAGDRPDFLATEETLPFVFALRGDREWARGPRGKSSPLAAEVWKLLEREGALSADAIKHALGRQLTESAALRALGDLWSDLRVEPVYTEGGETAWQPLQTAHERAMAAGAGMGQALAVSALVSLYLQSAVAATGDEMEAWLAPLASRSRVREAVRGLVATRQLGVRSLGAHEHFYVEGSLPEFPELADAARIAVPDLLPEILPKSEVPADIVVQGEDGARFRIEAVPEGGAEGATERGPGEGRKRFVAQREASGPGGRKGKPGDAERPARKPFFAREPWKEDRPSRPPGARPFADRGAGAPGSAGEGRRTPFGGERKQFGAGGTGERKQFGARGPRPFSAGSRTEGERPVRKPFAPRDASGNAPGGAFRDEPMRPRREEGGDRRAPREGAGFAPRTAGSPSSGQFSSRPPNSRPFGARPSGSRPPGQGTGTFRPFAPREGGDRKPFGFRPSGEQGAPADKRRGAPTDERRGDFGTRSGPGFGPKKPFGAREGASGQGGDRRPWQKRDAGPASRSYRPNQPPSRPGAPFAPRSEEDRPFESKGKPFRREGDGSASPRRTGAPGPGRFSPGGDRSGPRATDAGDGVAARPGGKRPRTAPFTSTGKPRPGIAAKPGRPGPKAGRTGFGAPKPGGGPRKPSGGAKRPGGKGPRRDG